MAPIEAKEGLGLVASIVGFFVAVYRFPNWLHKTFAKRADVETSFANCQENNCKPLKVEMINTYSVWRDDLKTFKSEMIQRENRIHERFDELLMRFPQQRRVRKKKRRR